jgi:hypothetical protein
MAAAALGLGCGSLFLRGAAIRRTSLSSSSSRNSIITRSHELRQSSQSLDSRCWKRVVVPAPRAALHRLADETERSNATSEVDAEKPLPGARFLLTATAALTPLLFTAQVESFNSRLLLTLLWRFFGCLLLTYHPCRSWISLSLGNYIQNSVYAKLRSCTMACSEPESIVPGNVHGTSENQDLQFLAMSLLN